MTEQEFKHLVLKMREAQKNFFATRNTGYLQESKKLEKEVDLILWPKSENTQKNLF